MTNLRKTLTLRGWAWLALLFLGLGVVTSTQATIARLGQPGAWPWWRMVVAGSSPWLAWALVVPLIVPAARHFTFLSQGRGRTLLIHLGLGFLLAPLWVFLNLASSGLITQMVDPAAVPWQFLARQTPASILAMHFFVPVQYLVIVGLSWAWAYHQRLKDQELRQAELQAQLARAELRSLKMHVNPHFMFNALNSISTLQRTDLDAAERTLELLAGLLRRSVDAGDVQEVPLAEEVDFLRDYLELEQIRFSNRLTLQWDLEVAAMEALVPHLLLQPLVENAIKHGFWPTARPGCIRIQAFRFGECLRIAVEDDGAGHRNRDSRPLREGVGLANTRARLGRMFGAEGRLELTDRAPCGMRAEVTIPFHTVPLSWVARPEPEGE